MEQPTLTPFNGKVALITGASKGIGKAIATELAQRGCHVYITARNGAKLTQTANEITQAGGIATPCPMDMTDADAVSTLRQSIHNAHGKLDILIANAGVLGGMGETHKTCHDDFVNTININLNANHLLVTNFHDLLMVSDAPRAIFLSSGAVRNMRPNWSTYSASKAALEALIITYAKETSNTKLRVIW